MKKRRRVKNSGTIQHSDRVQQRIIESQFAQSIGYLPGLWYGEDHTFGDVLFDTSLLEISNELLMDADWENPVEDIIRFMSRPENFWYTCKHLFNINLVPFQLAILDELWNKKFPMLLATRGGSKSFLLALYSLLRCFFHQDCKVVLIGAAFRQSKLIFEYMERIWRGSPVFQHIVSHGASNARRFGPKWNVDLCEFIIGESTAIAIPLGTGEKIRGLRANYVISDEFSCLEKDTLVETSDGLVRIGENDCKDLFLITGDKDVQYEKPANYIITPPTDVYEIKLGDGFVIRCSKDHMVMTQNGWKKPLELTNEDFVESYNKYGFPVKSKNGLSKKVARLLGILIGSGEIDHDSRIMITINDKDSAAFLMSEFDFDILEQPMYLGVDNWYYNPPYYLYKNDKSFRDSLYKLGLDYFTKDVKKIPHSILRSPKAVVLSFLKGLFSCCGDCFLLDDNTICFEYHSGSEILCRDIQIILDKLNYEVRIKRSNYKTDNDKWYIQLVNTSAYNFISQLNIDKFNDVIFSYNIHEDMTYILSSKKRGKYRVIYPYCGKKFDRVFDSLEEATMCVKQFKTLPKYRRIASVTKLDRQERLYDYYLPQTNSFYAGGCRQHNSIPLDIFEVVIRGFTSVSSSPQEKINNILASQIYTEEGLDDLAAIEREKLGFGNQTVIAGTSYYSFNHLYSYWKKYKAIVESRGDQHKLEEIFLGEVPASFDWKQYSVIRLPYTALPKGFMDDVQIAQAGATMQKSTFNMEYNCCVDESAYIITEYGAKNILDLNVGDKVLTHLGRFKKIDKLTRRYYNNDIIEFKTNGYYKELMVTPNHLFWQGDCWKSLCELKNCYLPRLIDLNDKKNIDIRNFVSNYMEFDNEIYAMASQSILTLSEKNEIKNNYNSIKDISKQYNVSYSTIYGIKKNRVKKPKHTIDPIVKLDYNFGLIIGYYASEGSVGSKGKSVAFSLDGHMNTTLESYVEELCSAIYSVFHIQAKKYKTGSVVNVVINNRLIVDFIKYICPGLSDTKYVIPDILYSNEQFMKGFIVGYFNGDGCIGDYDYKLLISSSSTSIKLSTQVRMVLSYFGIHASILYKDGGISYIRNKKTNTKPSYKLQFHGNHCRKFMNTFYHCKMDYKNSKSIILNTENCTILPIRQKEIKPYSGFVYNLEVEDDNSYCLLNGAVHNCFPRDSEGFFKRTLIESCVASDVNAIYLPSGRVTFSATVRGNPNMRYIYGIDPASESDNFAIVILEVHPDHKRIVYCWTVNRQTLRERLRNQGKADEKSYYNYCARKLRDLLAYFPSEHVGIDTQGGGIAIMEALHDNDLLLPGELPIWPYIKRGDDDPLWWEEKEKPTDGQPGLHILHMVQFANAQFTGEANHGLRKDFESKTTLFPFFDSAEIGRAIEVDAAISRTYDTLEDCVMDIESLKDELSTITHSQTSGGRDKWDTPEVKKAGGKVGRLRKDRYTALTIANQIARTINNPLMTPQYKVVGGYVVKGISKTPVTPGERLYSGPEHIVSKIPANYGVGVYRRGR